MWSRLVFGFLFVLQAHSLSPLTNDTQITVTNGKTVPCSCKVYDRESDILRQLLNQETIIRMALEKKVHYVLKDMVKIKEIMKTNNRNFREEIKAHKYRNQELKINTKRQLKEAKVELAALKQKIGKSEIKTNKQLQDASGEISALKKEIQSLKTNFENQFHDKKSLRWKIDFRIDVFKEKITESRVGFTAGVTLMSNSWEGNILVFPHVVTNTGYGYSTSTGKFTAPRAGTYVFFVTGVSWYKKGLNLDIVHNDADKVRTWSDSAAPWQTGTNLAVLQLSRGDTVWVRRSRGLGYYTHPVPLTTFSGFLL